MNHKTVFNHHAFKFCLAGLLCAIVLAPRSGLACACGCNAFDVPTSSIFPESPGGTAFFEYDYQDQNRNWRGSSKAPAENNDDKEIRTHFYTAGLQYMFDRSWGLRVALPYDDRHFKSENGASADWSTLGDIRVNGVYTGFSPDQSSGVNFGLKLPTGSYTHDGDVVDRDTEIGTGSTDLLLGGFHRGSLTTGNRWSWFSQAQIDVPVLTQDDYRPGTEIDAAAGSNYNGWSLRNTKIVPVAQVIASERTRDTGANSADPVASGYQRVLLSPGIEVHMHPVSLYADIEVPVYEHVTGNQLVAPALFKMIVSYMF